jgi:hypothetical protein
LLLFFITIIIVKLLGDIIILYSQFNRSYDKGAFVLKTMLNKYFKYKSDRVEIEDYILRHYYQLTQTHVWYDALQESINQFGELQSIAHETSGAKLFYGVSILMTVLISSLMIFIMVKDDLSIGYTLILASVVMSIGCLWLVVNCVYSIISKIRIKKMKEKNIV